MAKIYWRTIKRGTRTFTDLPSESMKEQVKALAMEDVANAVISEDEYKELIGEDYPIEK